MSIVDYMPIYIKVNSLDTKNKKFVRIEKKVNTMRIRQSFEQAICILLLIGTSETAIKNKHLSAILNVSDSYLKKVTRQLVVAGLITSKASKNGGFILNKPLEEITFLSIFNAIEGNESFIQSTNLVEKVFDPKRQVKQTQAMIINHLNDAEAQYRSQLNTITLAQIVKAAHNTK